MTKPHDDYKRLEFVAGTHVEPCPVCASAGELWQFSKSDDGPASKTVMCENGTAFGPQEGAVTEGCLLFMPPDDFYRATIREAVKYWNDYAVALGKIQRANRWKIAKVLRESSGPQCTCLGSQLGPHYCEVHAA